MNLSRAILFVLTPVILSACFSFPKTADDFRRDRAGALEFAVNLPLDESYNLIASNTIRCHEGTTSQMSMIGSSFIVFPTGGTRVKGDIDEDATRASIEVRFSNVTARGVLQVIDLEALEESRTRIIVHRLNDSVKWTSATQYVRDWFDGSTTCYDMSN